MRPRRAGLRGRWLALRRRRRWVAERLGQGRRNHQTGEDNEQRKRSGDHSRLPVPRAQKERSTLLETRGMVSPGCPPSTAKKCSTPPNRDRANHGQLTTSPPSQCEGKIPNKIDDPTYDRSMLDPASAQPPVAVDEDRRDIKHVAPAALHASFRSQQYSGSMITLVVPPGKRSDLMRLCGAWLASAARSRLFKPARRRMTTAGSTWPSAPTGLFEGSSRRGAFPSEASKSDPSRAHRGGPVVAAGCVKFGIHR